MSEEPTDLRYRVEGMDCAACTTKVEAALARLPGVEDVHTTAMTQILSLRLAGPTSRHEVERRVAALGYSLQRLNRGELASKGVATSEPVPWWRTRRGYLTIACAVALAAAFVAGRLFPPMEYWAYLGAMAVGLVPIARRAVMAAFSGTTFSIEMLMSVAAIGAVLIGATEEAAVVVFLFLVGELLEGVAANRARSSIQALTALVPKTALVESDGKTEEVPFEQLTVGTTILVRPGDRISADGVIIGGQSSVNEAPVTGESVPKHKGSQDSVFAGTINTDGVLRVRVSAAAEDNTIARVVRLVEEAQEAKAPTQRFIDRFSAIYTPGVIVLGALVALVPPLAWSAPWTEWIYKGLAVLLIGCPCALVISTPAAIAAALSSGARRGLLIKGGAVLEQLGTLTVAAFDKTGTLTKGAPKVTDVIATAGGESNVISLAAAIEAGSNHPLAVAILDHAKAIKAPVPPADDVTALAGKGVSGRVGGERIFIGAPQTIASLSPALSQRVTSLNEEGKTVSVVTRGEGVAGLIGMRDEPREDARRGIDALKSLGLRAVMLTGDNRVTAAAIGRDLGVEVQAQLLPEDKQRIVQELQQRGERVVKVGDGINDAPALAAADVGIAMGGGTDVALETADAAVLHGRVLDVANMVKLSRRTMTNIRQNITIAVGLKAAFLVSTIIGLTGLWPAILADTGATVLVTVNALRLLRPS